MAKALKPTLATETLTTPEAPQAIRLQSFYSFYDEDSTHRQFSGVISDPEQIDLLIARGVEFEVVEQ